MEQLEHRNRRGYDTGGLRGIFARLARALPAFVVCAFISCSLWYYAFHVPLDQLSAVAAVPCVVGFVMTRILALILPASVKDSELVHPPALVKNLVALSVLAAFVAGDFLFSAAIYYRLEPRYVVLGALKIVQLSGLIAGALIVLALLAGLIAKFKLWAPVLAATVNLLRSETRLTNALFIPPSRKHWS
ncbi:MAG: hypothetical protein WAM04_15175 [Candidatus Sulfotelmatobacter sp.]